MPVPMVVEGFPDVLDVRFFEITDGSWPAEPDPVPYYFSQHEATQRQERWSALTDMGPTPSFGGVLDFAAPSQGYDVVATNQQYAQGTQVEWELVRFDKFGIIEERFTELEKGTIRRRNIDCFSIFTGAFSIDTSVYTHSEAVALCANAHTSASGASTASGFDNMETGALTPLQLKTSYTNFRKFRSDANNPIDGHVPDLLLVPVDLKDRADEIVKTVKGLDNANETKNVQEGRYEVKAELRLTNTTNYFLINKMWMKKNLHWFDSLKPKFSRVEDFSTILALYRVHMAYMWGYADWRWVLGHNVS